MRINHNKGRGNPSPNNKYEPLKGLGILLCTPSLDGKCSMHYAASLSETVKILSDKGVAVAIAKSDNSCFVDLSRNLFIQRFDQEKAYTHLLQIDDDMSWSPDSVLEMLLKDKEFIAGVGRKKTMDEQYAAEMIIEGGEPIGELGEKETDVLLKMKRVGGAFTLMKRSVVDKLKNNFPDHKNESLGYTFYRLEYDEKGLITEDYYFCRLLDKCGIDIWCYPNVTMGHLGNYDFKGNYFDFLKMCKEKEDDIMIKIPEVKQPNKLIEDGFNNTDSLKKMQQLVTKQSNEMYGMRDIKEKTKKIISRIRNKDCQDFSIETINDLVKFSEKLVNENKKEYPVQEYN